jgi:1-acyl-sn-glycerol-3-phosphate acyltransferase
MALTPEQRRQVGAARIADAGHGWDRFCMSAGGVGEALAAARRLHEHYFRVASHGASSIPAAGPAILVANHSGMLPLDAMMLWADVVLRTNPARVPRPIADHFVPALPFVSTFFARAGMIAGSRGNVRAALEAGELLEVFPEGVAGIGKPRSERYRLQRWSVGHAELAMRHGAAIVPVGVVGAEEAWPQLMKIERFGLLGVPYLPIPATPLPLPVRFHIRYGDPIVLSDDFTPADADDPDALHEAALRVRTAVAALLAEGLARRGGLFA